MKLLNKLFAVSILAALYSPTHAQAYVDETHCMALNIYHEAKNQSMIGQIAVGLVTMNRVRDHRYPNTVCEVVYQGPSRPSWKDPNKRIPISNKIEKVRIKIAVLYKIRFNSFPLVLCISIINLTAIGKLKNNNRIPI